MKDSFWFRHDSNAGRDLKLIKLCQLHTHWGKGVYWDVVEVLREQPKYKFPCDESSLQMLSGMISCADFLRFLNWYKDCKKLELFYETGNCFTSESLVKRMKSWESKKKNGSKAKSKRNKSESGGIREEKNREEKIGEEGEIISKCLKDELWVESAKRISKRKDIPALLETFKNHLVSTGSTGKSEKDFRSHFMNWVRKQPVVASYSQVDSGLTAN